MEEIAVGSKETLLVDVTDKLANITALPGGTVYDVLDHTGATKMGNIAAVVTGMTAGCLIDTTIGGNWTPGHYFLYLRFPANPDVPRLGPLEFKVNP